MSSFSRKKVYGGEKIAFKFTIDEAGVTTSPKKVKADLDEYIERIRSGDPLDDLPVVDDPIEHQRLLMALRNRISFLQHNYEVQKNVNDFYARLLTQFNLGAATHYLPAVQINQGAIDMDQRRYIASRSANVIQGDDHQNVITGNTVTIGDTYAEKKGQIEKLERLIAALDTASGDSAQISQSKRNLENVKEELGESKEPDKNMIAKWLERTKSALNVAKIGAEVAEKAKEVFDSFGVVF